MSIKISIFIFLGLVGLGMCWVTWNLKTSSSLPLENFAVSTQAEPTFANHLNVKTNDFWSFTNRTDYLSHIRTGAQRQLPMSFRSTFSLGLGGGNLPDQEAFQTFRTLNPTATLIQYNNLFSVHVSQGEAMMGNIDSNEAWFLHDQQGRRVLGGTGNTRPNLYFGHSQLRQYLLDRAIQYVQAGATGLELDSFEIQMKNFENNFWQQNTIQIVNPATNKTYTQDQWETDLRGALSALRTGLDQRFGAGKAHIVANALENDMLRVSSDPFYQSIFNGYYREGFASRCQEKAAMPDWWFNPPTDAPQFANFWERDVESLRQAEASNKYYIACINTVSSGHSQGQLALFGVSSLLMGIKGQDTQAYIFTWTFGGWPGLAQLPLARFTPTAPYQKVNGVYQRLFTTTDITGSVYNTLALTNPTKIPQTVTLPKSYHRLQPDGVWSTNPITSLNLPSLSGEVLIDARVINPISVSTPTPEPTSSTTQTSAPVIKTADFNNDNKVDVQDLILLLQNWGSL